MKTKLTLICILFAQVFAFAQSSSCFVNDNVIDDIFDFGNNLYSVCATMEGGVESCSPQMLFSNEAFLTLPQILVMSSYPPELCFHMFENDPEEEPAQLIIEVEYVCPISGITGQTLCSESDWPTPNDQYIEVIFGNNFYEVEFDSFSDVEISSIDIPGPVNDINVEVRTYTYTVPLLIDSPTYLGTQGEVVRVTSTYFGEILFDFVAKVNVFGDEVLEDPEWTTQAPTLPNLILRDPPGDESYAFLEENSTTCHGYGMSVGSENSVEAWSSVKVGASGSAGLVAEVDYEVYAELSGGVEIGITQTSEAEYQMCFETSTAYQTSAENGLVGDGEDVFVATAINYAYGVYKTFMPDENDPCQAPQVKSEMILAPLGTTNTVIYTQDHIVNTIIPDMQENLTTLDPSSAAYETMSDQLEVWEQAIQINEELKAEAEYTTGTAFNGGAGFDQSISLTTSEMKSIETNMYIDAFVAIEIGAEVNGSGASAGVTIRARTEQGSTSSSSNQSTNTIGYHLGDDDAIDNFNLDIYTDRAFGTPVFVLNEDLSQSSCPYEGGFQIDQPLLTFESGATELTLEDIPAGTQATFQINVCNDSNEDRYYNLKVNPATNAQGAILQGFGENLSSTDLGFEILVPANNCINSATITLTQTSDQTLDYEGIELYLYALCQPASAPILSSIFLNAYFTDVNGLAENTLPEFKIYPNPSNGHFQIDVSGIDPGAFMSIYDLSGRVIHQEQIQTSTLLDVQVNGASPGMYLVEIQSPEGKRTKKITIQ
jgi:hypothetical protein